MTINERQVKKVLSALHDLTEFSDRPDVKEQLPGLRATIDVIAEQIDDALDCLPIAADPVDWPYRPGGPVARPTLPPPTAPKRIRKPLTASQKRAIEEERRELEDGPLPEELRTYFDAVARMKRKAKEEGRKP